MHVISLQGETSKTFTPTRAKVAPQKVSKVATKKAKPKPVKRKLLQKVANGKNKARIDSKRFNRKGKGSVKVAPISRLRSNPKSFETYSQEGAIIQPAIFLTITTRQWMFRRPDVEKPMSHDEWSLSGQRPDARGTRMDIAGQCPRPDVQVDI